MTADSTAIAGKDYAAETSGRITTKGNKAFTHGRIELLARLPEGKGIWPGSPDQTIMFPQQMIVDYVWVYQ